MFTHNPPCNYGSSFRDVISSSAPIIAGFSTPLTEPVQLREITNCLSSANFAAPANIASQNIACARVRNNSSIMGQMSFYDCEGNKQHFHHQNVSPNLYHNQDNSVIYNNINNNQMTDYYYPLATLNSENKCPKDIVQSDIVNPAYQCMPMHRSQYVSTYKNYDINRTCNENNRRSLRPYPRERKRKPRRARNYG
ncbi:hypothetical protein NPIL_412001 [Nephila pilipes]|uniref:Uncharacterized protein n=1 Tax=Nephila pilipes TaxID=299642 RepID=A0A8X6TTQ8_NEPPI|nr:hypothetical protein NPIL_412001 [Nephila pilipes]